MAQNRSSSLKTLLIILAFVVGLFLVGAMAILGPGMGLLAMAVVLGLIVGIWLGYLALCLLIIGVHELGHYYAGRIAGFEFRGMKVGPFYWWWRNERVAFEWDRKSFSLTGFAQMIPKKTDRLPSRYALLVAGGPIASFILFALVLVLYLQVKPLGEGESKSLILDLAPIMLMGTTWAAGAVAVFNSVPYHTRGIANDGMRIWNLLRGGEKTEQYLRAFKFHMQIEAGDRCRDWNIPDLRVMADSPAPALQRAVSQTYLGHALIYQGQVEEGIGYLEQAYQATEKSSQVFEAFEKVISLDTAFARAYFKGDVAGAEAALKRAERSALKQLYGERRAQAALALAKGEGEEAIRLSNEALEELKKSVRVFKPIHEGCFEEMATLQERAKSQSGP